MRDLPLANVEHDNIRKMSIGASLARESTAPIHARGNTEQSVLKE